MTGCAFAAGSVTLTIDPPATAIIGVNVVAGDDEIVFDNDNTLAGASQCDTATVANMNLIDVNGSSGGETFFIDLSDGPFASNDDFNIDLLTGSDQATMRVAPPAATTTSVTPARAAPVTTTSRAARTDLRVRTEGLGPQGPFHLSASASQPNEGRAIA